MSAPTIGRIVHYKSYGTPGGEYEPECRPAVITEVVHPQRVGLFVMTPNGSFHNHSDQDEAQSGGTWHYPCVRGED